MVERTNNPNHSNQLRPALNPVRRLSVRLSLATGATLVTLLGAQTLALLEHPSGIAQSTKSTNLTTSLPSATAIMTKAPTSLPPAPPHLTIIRNPGTLPTPAPARPRPSSGGQGSKGSGASSSNNNQFAPPNPELGQVVIAVQPSQPQPSTGSSK